MEKIKDQFKLSSMVKSLMVLNTIILLVLSSCSSSKKMSKNQVGQKLEIPCEGKKYTTDKKYFRASQLATSMDLSFAREKALLLTKQRMATNIESLIKSVSDRYVRDMGINNDSEFEQDIENETREVVRIKLSDVTIICESNHVLEDGQFRTFMAIEMDKENIINELNRRISKNDKLRLEYDQQKFREIFEEEMEKLDNEENL